jgi:hypothetical protein
MKISAICIKCGIENPSSNVRIEGYLTVDEENLYHFKCYNGHDNLIEVLALKFEILFESGLCAIKDRYYLESILSLTASLERFYEFYVRIILLSSGISNDDFDKMYNNMANQSERQYGAFLTAYTSFYREFPLNLIDPKFIEFRNKVVHKGYLPNETETLKYAEEIYRLIRYHYTKLLADHEKVITEYTCEVQKQRHIKNKDLIKSLNVLVSGLSPWFVIPDSFNKDEQWDFTKCYERIKKTNFYG